jgi:propanediol dehydratase small subunit
VDQQALENLVKQIILNVNNGKPASGTPTGGSAGSGYTYMDYPLGEKKASTLRTPTGKGMADITLEEVLAGNITGADVRITPETLEAQAQIAESVGRGVFAKNLRRAAELIAIPDVRLLEMYNALRPYKSTKAELMAMANELKTQYNAHQTAVLVEEAAAIYEARGRLKQS